MSQAGTSIGGSTPPIVSTLTINVQTFTSNGTYTPTADLQYAIIEVCGGGGGGGGSGRCQNAVDEVSYGNGGAGGEYGRGVFSVGTIGASQTVTIGAAGAGGSSAVGSAGGTTSVGALISALGGDGGTYTAPTTSITIISWNAVGGASGGAGGDYYLSGQSSLAYYREVNISDGYLFFYQQGGDSQLGRGGIQTTSSNTIPISAGVNATGFGGGGSGAYNACGPGGDNPALDGGNGTPGVVIITEYILA